MKKIIISLSILILLPLSIMAQEASIAKLYNWLDTSQGLQVQLRYKVGSDKEQSATYYGYKQMFYLESEQMRAWYDGKNLWVYISQNEEINLTTPDVADLAEINPLLNLSIVNTRDYKIREEKGNGGTTLHAQPKNPSEMEWVEITLAPNAFPLALKLKERGVQEVLQVQIISLKQDLHKEVLQRDFYRFTKNKLPGVMVIDLR